MSWGPDPDGINGVYLGKNVAAEAGKALQMALTAITPKVRHRQRGGGASREVHDLRRRLAGDGRGVPL
jgi:hypothetical protein